MAREITLNLKISTLKGDLNHTENAGTLFVDLTGTTAVGGAARHGAAYPIVFVLDGYVRAHRL